MRRAIERGLTTADFENMTLGMIIDFLITSQNEDSESREKDTSTRAATQDDIDAF